MLQFSSFYREQFFRLDLFNEDKTLLIYTICMFPVIHKTALVCAYLIMVDLYSPICAGEDNVKELNCRGWDVISLMVL